MHTAGPSPLESARRWNDEIPHAKEYFCDKSPQNDHTLYVGIVPQGSFQPNDLYSQSFYQLQCVHMCTETSESIAAPAPCPAFVTRDSSESI